MSCLFVILGLMLPRVGLVLAFLLTPWFERSFENWFVPLLGFIFLPLTTLAYIFAFSHTGGAFTLGWMLIIFAAFLVDLGNWGGSGYHVRRRKYILMKK